MDKSKVAEILIDIGMLLELKGENPFKTRAYGNAARAIENLPEPLEKLVAEDRLTEVAHSGRALDAAREVLRRHNGLWFYDESYVISRRRD